MPRFTSLSIAEQQEIILRTAEHKKISPLLIEKDYWVCWVLRRLFSINIASFLTFKGGTSLSKCFGVIKRFSEDCDITIDKSLFIKNQEDTTLSRKQFQKLLDITDEKATVFIHHDILPRLSKVISDNLPSQAHWALEKEELEAKNLRFYYPSALVLKEYPYVKKSVLIEMGVRGEIYPSEDMEITAYIEEVFSNILEKEAILIRTLSPIRTFWEKITLLHAENNRPSDKKLGDRISRHYYDVYQLLQTDIPKKALSDLEILYDVIDNKAKFFRSSWAHYETAVPGTLNIVPHEALLAKLKVDYQKMNLMIFEGIPDFLKIIETISQFQAQFNTFATKEESNF
ncbi:nucleotidyl transferase AbiEii/AbiGii toxin family protein [Candidatus Odyssella thessalonicensis]|uniref:nucleotidyl transferase AbiEii/AbiGii toxin family protein n=1 Tax=Candidatus Odyssella thessalonicensis TaxID=84647 RepID=UPI0002D7700F|nr:nucleotidyl transferase AbiEii/AbiGii toxin family protein [Candidatus Odyssella thessalonicensis]